MSFLGHVSGLGRASRLGRACGAALAAAAIGLTLVSAGPAEAGRRTGTWKYYPYGVGRHAYYGGGHYRPYYGGYRGGYYGGYRNGYYGNGWNNGGAVAAGVIGGLALGALAAQPSYGYSYPAYSGYPAYSAYPGDDCFYRRQVVYDSWGYPHNRRVLVCH